LLLLPLLRWVLLLRLLLLLLLLLPLFLFLLLRLLLLLLLRSSAFRDPDSRLLQLRALYMCVQVGRGGALHFPLFLTSTTWGVESATWVCLRWRAQIGLGSAQQQRRNVRSVEQSLPSFSRHSNPSCINCFPRSDDAHDV
jgi:hypothetical protein